MFREILERFGIACTIEDSASDFIFSEAQIADFEQNQQNFMTDCTTTHDWEDIKKELDCVFP